ncbi:unnamed protein product [Rhizophagus irregularis]|nr:unnamed protein product [Rhizophagus irregularis]
MLLKRILKVYSFLDASWMKFQRFRMPLDFYFEAERQVLDSYIEDPGFLFKELQRFQGLYILKLLCFKIFFIYKSPLFVGIEPIGIISKPLITYEFEVKITKL